MKQREPKLKKNVTECTEAAKADLYESVNNLMTAGLPVCEIVKMVMKAAAKEKLTKRQNELTEETKAEFIGQIIDIFEDFLSEKKMTLENPEKKEDECAANIYGSDYGNLQSELENLIENWGIEK